ncbi:MAG: response regulator [Dehalococcoidales bacterium]|nr:response regulator [Dehalococcoidales bacterium]
MKQKTILIVDDEIGYAEGIIDALDFEGFRVLTANSAEVALRSLKEGVIDLAMVDIMMPPGHSLENRGVRSDRTGVVLCRTIKELYPRLPVICLSVVSNIDTIREIERLHIRFLRKGEVPLQTILDTINTLLFGRSFPSAIQE